MKEEAVFCTDLQIKVSSALGDSVFITGTGSRLNAAFASCEALLETMGHQKRSECIATPHMYTLCPLL